MDFYSPAHGQLVLVPGLPPDFKGPFLAGSHQHHFSHAFGSIVLQEIATEQFRLESIIFYFLQKVKLTGKIDAGLKSLFLAVGESKQEFLHYRKFLLRESQFVLMQGKEIDWKFELPPSRPTHFFKTSYSSATADEASEAFTSLRGFLKGENPGMIGPVGAHAAIQDAVHQMLHASYTPDQLPFYFKHKVGDYLFHLLDRSTVKESYSLVPTDWEKEAVYKVRDLILTNVLEHIAVAELAKKVKINTFRLKVFFKNEFGVGPYRFLLHARLDKAKELLEGGMPMKVAAPLAGYTTTSFITAFRRRFGYSPGVIQRKK